MINNVLYGSYDEDSENNQQPAENHNNTKELQQGFPANTSTYNKYIKWISMSFTATSMLLSIIALSIAASALMKTDSKNGNNKSYLEESDVSSLIQETNNMSISKLFTNFQNLRSEVQLLGEKNMKLEHENNKLIEQVFSLEKHINGSATALALQIVTNNKICSLTSVPGTNFLVCKSTEVMNYVEAKAYCKRINGRIATSVLRIPDARTRLIDVYTNVWAWVGLAKTEDGSFVYEDGVPANDSNSFLTNNRQENCVTVYHLSSWSQSYMYTYDCDQSHSTLCQFEL